MTETRRDGGRRIALSPEGPFADHLARAVEAAGLERTTDPAEADGLVWCSTSPAGIEEYLAAAPDVTWVQLPYAGIERFLPFVGDGRTWTCAKDVYGPAVAEFAVGLLIAGFRGLHRYARSSTWEPVPDQTLSGAHVAILGGGGIGRSLAEMLEPFDAAITIVSRSGGTVGHFPTVPATETETTVRQADAVVLAVPLTPETTGLVDRTFLSWMKPTAWLVNVARGRVVVTEDLVAVLADKAIGGACLDVTDPEPLPDDHPLWGMDNVLVTPHAANTGRLAAPVLARLVEENCRLFAVGAPLSGVVDPAAGY